MLSDRSLSRPQLHIVFIASVLALLVLFACLTWAADDGMQKAAAAPQALDYEELPLAEAIRKAKKGDPSAQYEVGRRFSQGRDVPKNIGEAMTWLRAAAEKRHLEAMRQLALIYFQGQDIPADHDEAFKWTRQLAEAGDGPGQMMLGNLYANGEGTPRDLIRAYAWYDIASASAQQALSRGEPLAQAELDNALMQRTRIAALLLPEEEAEAQSMASNWWLARMGVKLPMQPPESTKARKDR